ncbi:hypothetical protein CERSUDRAFT_119863 [Gelatoporia subvermispora B]|uniref:4a-hydroxytetrahydrobiopterin dehydratase n=1 Tax=Ceriporiopsis subvermispora (strain B) TaxID=914234 RepID=M2QGY5_CERS8|nr:hypothetical protein CERSUDRAFT_119863 [Gelatoporia subvermispora B]
MASIWGAARRAMTHHRFSSRKFPPRGIVVIQEARRCAHKFSNGKNPYDIVSELLLPPLPAKPLRKSTTHLTSEEIQDYLEPLYSRGWVVYSSQRAYGSSPYSPDASEGGPSPELVKGLWFRSNASAVRFLRTALDIAEKENHHPTHISLISRHIILRMHTHEAVPNEELSHVVQDPVVPGITLRDVRLAYLLENAYVHAVINRETLNTSRMTIQNQELPWTALQLEKLRYSQSAESEEDGAKQPEIKVYAPRMKVTRSPRGLVTPQYTPSSDPTGSMPVSAAASAAGEEVPVDPEDLGELERQFWNGGSSGNRAAQE